MAKTYEVAIALGAKLLSNFNATFNAASKQINGLEAKSNKANKGFLGLRSGIGKVVGAATGMAVAVGAGLGLKAMFTTAQATQQKLSQMDAVLKSTGGAAGMSKQALLQLADAQSKVTTFSKGTIISGENLLLTFTGIGKNVFPATIKAAQDMSTAMGTDLNTSVMTLGKALNNPAEGLSKLTKQGVTFTAEQQKQVKAMVAAGNTAGAQSIMLKELQKEFGGSAEAAGKTFAGQLTVLKNQLTGVGGSIMGTLMPAATKFISAISSNMPKIQSFITNVINNVKPYIEGVINDIVKIASNFLPQLNSKVSSTGGIIKGVVSGAFGGFKTALDWIANHGEMVKTAVKGIALAVSAYGLALAVVTIKEKAAMIIEALSKAWWMATGIIGAYRNGMSLAAIAQDVFNVAMEANPVGMYMVAIMALVGVVVLVYKNWSKISKFFSGLWNGVKNIFNGFWNWLKGFFSKWGVEILAVLFPFMAVPLLVAKHWGQIKNVLNGVWNTVKASVKFGWNAIKNVVSSAVTAVVQVVAKIWSTIVKAVTGSALFKVVSAIFKGILAIVIIVGYNIYKAFTSIWKSVSTTVKSVLTTIWSFISSIWNKIYTTISNILRKVWSVISSIWNTIYTAIATFLTNIWNAEVRGWTLIFNTISSVLTKIWNVIVSIWNSIYNSIASILKTIWSYITNIWNTVYSTISGIVTNIWNTIVSGFTNAYNGVVSIFSSLKNTIATIFNDVWSVIKSVINGGIGMINGFIGGVNKAIGVANKVPGVNIGTVEAIPKLAHGGYIKHRPGGILANIGEGSEDEIVSPISKLKSIVGNMSGGGMNISYSPNIIIQGNASKDDVVEALSISQSQFDRFMDNYMRKKARVSFNNE